MKKAYKVTRVGDKIAVVLYGKTGNMVHQGFIQTSDIDRLMPLFKRYLKVSEVTSLVAAIKAV